METGATTSIKTYQPTGFARRLMAGVLVAVWAKLDPTKRPPTTPSGAPSDNMQRTMSLVMTLRDPSPLGRAALLELVAAFDDVALCGLRNLAVLHYARLDILDDKLCFFSIYDGDLATYVPHLVRSVGTFLTNLMNFVEDAPPLPVELNVEAFVDWVNDHGVVELPDDLTALSGDLKHLPRRLLVLLHGCPNLQVFSHSNYTACTAAQIRDVLNL